MFGLRLGLRLRLGLIVALGVGIVSALGVGIVAIVLVSPLSAALTAASWTEWAADGLGGSFAEFGERFGVQVVFVLEVFEHKLELRAIVVEREPGDRQKRRFERLLDESRQGRNEFVAIEQRLLRADLRVDPEIIRAGAGSVGIPEVVGLADPVRGYGGIIKKRSKVLGAEPIRLMIVGDDVSIGIGGHPERGEPQNSREDGQPQRKNAATDRARPGQR